MRKIIITKQLLEEIRSKAEKATPGPWYAGETKEAEKVYKYSSGNRVYTRGRKGFYAGRIEVWTGGAPENYPENWEEARNDAAYIAAVPPDVVLAMIEKISDLEKEINESAES